MTSTDKPARATPGKDPAPAHMRLVRITRGSFINGPWHDVEPAGWSVGIARALCGTHGHGRYLTADQVPAHDRRCPSCVTASRRRREAK